MKALPKLFCFVYLIPCLILAQSARAEESEPEGIHPAVPAGAVVTTVGALGWRESITGEAAQQSRIKRARNDTISYGAEADTHQAVADHLLEESRQSRGISQEANDELTRARRSLQDLKQLKTLRRVRLEVLATIEGGKYSEAAHLAAAGDFSKVPPVGNMSMDAMRSVNDIRGLDYKIANMAKDLEKEIKLVNSSYIRAKEKKADFHQAEADKYKRFLADATAELEDAQKSLRVNRVIGYVSRGLTAFGAGAVTYGLMDAATADYDLNPAVSGRTEIYKSPVINSSQRSQGSSAADAAEAGKL